jgi:cytochrome b
MADFVAADGVDPAAVRPYDESNVDPERYRQLKEFKKPFGLVHIYTSYFLMFLVAAHIGAVFFAEIREGNGLVSAMLSGRKVISGNPVDDD